MTAAVSTVALGRAICGDEWQATRREWLVADGLGGYASGTVAGEATRKYHGLLVAATDPPGRRVLLLAALDAELAIDGETIRLATHRWGDGTVDPKGYVHLERFELEDRVPTWSWAMCGVLLEQRVWMRHGEPTTLVQFTLRRGGPVRLRLKALTTHRSHHAPNPAPRPGPRVDRTDGGVRVVAHEGAAVLHLAVARTGGSGASAAWQPAEGALYRNIFLREEAARGYDATDAVHHAATIEIVLKPGQSFTVAASTTAVAPFAGDAELSVERARTTALLQQAEAMHGAIADPARRALVLAADPFLVRRNVSGGGTGTTVIAGYPWFEDWGRDAMISLPGLCLATGRIDEAASVLRLFAASLEQGMLPNRFPDEGGVPEFNTVDATLWFVEAVARTIAVANDPSLLPDLWPALESIVEWHQRGTRHGIGVDPADGLLRAGEPGVQLTWMDAKVGDWVVTPRIGKPVEIAGLWHNALCRMGEFARRLGADSSSYAAAAAKAAAGFARFWNPDRNCLFDVLDGPDGNDPSVRPNQVLAVALAHVPLDDARRRAVLARCEQALLTSHGLRTLAPDDPAYIGRYAGDQRSRDAAYHQGTVWPWPLASFVRAHLAVHGDAAAGRDLLCPLLLHLSDAGLGSTSEVFDGEAPHEPGGCPWQAWSVAAILESFHAIDAVESVRGG
ncbi:MAG: glycogen debranching enzyme family protein [Phycisphaerales bacterium]|nr:glycogen debranching enzyme family protein [Phycisphaerales bacterium]